eukprot:COSAG01_NODE_1838_length_9083_cov_3.184328_3_plen_65_part_00
MLLVADQRLLRSLELALHALQLAEQALLGGHLQATAVRVAPPTPVLELARHPPVGALAISPSVS